MAASLQWSSAGMDRLGGQRELSHVADLRARLGLSADRCATPVPARVPAQSVERSRGFLFDFKHVRPWRLLLINLIFLLDARLLVPHPLDGNGLRSFWCRTSSQGRSQDRVSVQGGTCCVTAGRAEPLWALPHLDSQRACLGALSAPAETRCSALPQDGSLQCPSCKTIYGEKTGTQPQGKMEVFKFQVSLPGHEDCGTILIVYNIPHGIQVRGPSTGGASSDRSGLGPSRSGAHFFLPCPSPCSLPSPPPPTPGTQDARASQVQAPRNQGHWCLEVEQALRAVEAKRWPPAVS